jgi:hypothetical protein
MPIRPFRAASTLTKKSIPAFFVVFVNNFCFLVNERRVIKLNQNESKIFHLLRECVREANLPVTLRVAGGWVRDKVRIFLV